MQTLSRNSSGKNNKSCSTFHQESNKIGFAFVWFFYDFLRIFKDSAKALYYLRIQLLHRPLELSADSQPYPCFTFRTLERVQMLQCGLWPMVGGGSPEFRRSGGRGRPGAGGEWLGVTEDRSPCWVGVEAAPAGSCGCNGRQRPPGARLRRGGCSAGQGSETVSTSRHKRRRRAPQLGFAVGQALGAPWLPPMAGRERSTGVGGGSARKEKGATAVL
jgi:hypothetical protein